MRIKKSVCTNLVFPKTRKDIDEFARVTEFLKSRGVDSMEFYHDGEARRESRIGDILDKNDMEGIYIAVIPSKEQGLHACSAEEENRRASVKLFCSCMDEAADNGISVMMLNSGRIGANVKEGLKALKETIGSLYEYMAKKHYSMRLTLEPCDSWMFARQLLGPTARTAAFLEDCHRAGLPLELTMDSAHTLEEGEDFLEAVKAVKPFCRHLHFANCYIKDEKSPLYGDQHVGFEYADTEWDYQALIQAWPAFKEMFDGDELRVAVEVLCREEDPYVYFDNMWSRMPFVNVE
ncbi:MAG: TIM barrel protein [Lachnospiraceae bacterium]|nr:TIM barrel protein [Lachnospiraceae bacterium]